MTRILDLADGFSSASAPSVTGTITVTGSTGTPESIVAGTGITVADANEEIIFVEGSGGSVNITADPQISDPSITGAKLKIIGTSDTNTLILEDGDGLSLNGSMVLGDGDIISLIYDGTDWVEQSRSE